LVALGMARHIVIPTTEGYADELQVFNDNGWEVSFRQSTEDPLDVRLCGRHRHVDMQFDSRVDRLCLETPELMPDFIQGTWRELEHEFGTKYAFPRMRVYYTTPGRATYREPTNWEQLQALIGSRVTPEDVQKVSFRRRHKIVLASNIEQAGQVLYELDFGETRHHGWALLRYQGMGQGFDALAAGRFQLEPWALKDATYITNYYERPAAFYMHWREQDLNWE
jgi:hypothetical protein